MQTFRDDAGRAWFATALEEQTPRHHGRWFLVFQPADEPAATLSMPEVRWKNAVTAERTLRTMSEFELRKRLATVKARAGAAGLSG